MSLRYKRWVAVFLLAAAVIGSEFGNAYARGPGGRPAPVRPPHETISRPTDSYPTGRDFEENGRTPEPVLDERWSATGSSEQKSTLERLLGHRLPGPAIVLATFLDATYYRSDLSDINAAWKSKNSSNADEFPNRLDAIDAYFQMHAGGTVMLVSHVDGDSFVLTDADGRTKASIPIAEVSASALKHNVFFIPIGCETAKAGAPIGFMEKINSSGVVKFLARLGDAPTFQSLFDAMAEIGTLHIDLTSGLPVIEAALVPWESRLKPVTETGPDPGRPGGIRIRATVPHKVYSLAEEPESPVWVFSKVVMGGGLLAAAIEYVSGRSAQSNFILKRRSGANWLGTLMMLNQASRFLRKAFVIILGLVVAAMLIGAAPGLIVCAVLLFSLYLNIRKHSGD